MTDCIIPAVPGTYVIAPGTDDRGNVVTVKFTVIGWRVIGRIVEPMFVSATVVPCGDQWTVLHPDGRVECRDGRQWNTLDGWLREVVLPLAA